MNTLDILLINVISYMGGFLTGLGIFIKYKHVILVKTNNIDFLELRGKGPKKKIRTKVS